MEGATVADLAKKIRPGLMSIYLAGLLFIFFGIRYSPDYFASVLTSTGQLPSKISAIIWSLDVLLVVFGLTAIFLAQKIAKYGKELVLFLVSFSLFFFMVEVLFRFYFYSIDPVRQALYLDPESIRLQPLYSRHHYLQYFPTPGYKSFDGLNKHNLLGYRGDEIILPKPDGVYRIVTLGGSTTYGVGVKSYKESYPYLLQKELHEKYHLSHVEVVNAGVGGYTSFENLINFQFRVLDLNPDIVYLYFGTNDVHTRLTNPKFYRGDNSGSRKPWAEGIEPFFFRSVLVRFIVTKITGYSLEPAVTRYVTADIAAPYLIETSFNERLGDSPLNVLKKNKPIYFESNLRNIVSIAKEHDVAVLLATWAHTDQFSDYASTPHYEFGFMQHNEIIKQEGKRHNVPVFDFANKMSKNKKYWVDGRHLNFSGNKIKAELFADFFYQQNLISLHE